RTKSRKFYFHSLDPHPNIQLIALTAEHSSRPTRIKTNEIMIHLQPNGNTTPTKSDDFRLRLQLTQ
ncbi:hypothetical protein, partial [Pseudomonas putida]|uniref:hypothetical protein n=1 Tax=Pseudomonas putida TaxID=303 RepID=UPI003905A699